jgi:hypothetical protein
VRSVPTNTRVGKCNPVRSITHISLKLVLIDPCNSWAFTLEINTLHTGLLTELIINNFSSLFRYIAPYRKILITLMITLHQYGPQLNSPDSRKSRPHSTKFHQISVNSFTHETNRRTDRHDLPNKFFSPFLHFMRRTRNSP